MASSVLMGAFQGDGVNLNPNANITRQEAFTVLARLFTLSGGDQSVLNSYTDGDQVADWAKDSICLLYTSKAFVFAPSQPSSVGTYSMDEKAEQALYDLGLKDFHERKEELLEFLKK